MARGSGEWSAGRRWWGGVIAAAVGWAVAGLSAAEAAPSARRLVERGNAAWARAEYDEALAAYSEAALAAPAAPEILFNQGTAHYGKGEFAKAAELFERARVAASEADFEARCSFNLGNCAAREAERRKDSDLRATLEGYERSVRHYQAALDRRPEFREAAENIEMVRLRMKVILDELKRREEAEKERREQQQKAAEDLKNLIEKQESLNERGRQAAERRESQGATPETRQEAEKLADEQSAVEKETRELAGKLPKPEDRAKGGDDAREHLEQAAEHQRQSGNDWRGDRPKDATEQQAEAAKRLKQALEAMTRPESGAEQGQDGQKKPDETPQGKGGAEDRKEGTEPEKRENGETEQSAQNEASEQGPKDPGEVVPLPDEARGILDEERERRDTRRRDTGYRPVERDW